MNRLLLIILVGLVWANNSFARDTRATRDNSLLARVTVYWAHGGRGADRYTRQHKSATGTRLQQGHCAVDPKKIPYGSRVVLPDGTALAAVDTGSAVRNRKAARGYRRDEPDRRLSCGYDLRLCITVEYRSTTRASGLRLAVMRLRPPALHHG